MENTITTAVDLLVAMRPEVEKILASFEMTNPPSQSYRAHKVLQAREALKWQSSDVDPRSHPVAYGTRMSHWFDNRKTLDKGVFQINRDLDRLEEFLAVHKTVTMLERENPLRSFRNYRDLHAAVIRENSMARLSSSTWMIVA